MPRTRTVAEATYPPGSYGPFSVDNFTNQNTDFLEVAMSIVGWPTSGGALFDLSMSWDDGGAPTVFHVPAQVWQDKLGNPKTEALFRIGVPRIATGNGKGQVAGGNLSLTVFQSFTTAITVRAV